MKTETVDSLIEKTNKQRNHFPHAISPNRNPEIPESIFKYNPIIWQENDGVWHTLFGSMPDEGIWTIGTTALESMQEFDKEIKWRLSEGKFIKDIPEEVRQELHRQVFEKVL